MTIETFATARLESAGYTGMSDRVAAAFNQIMDMEISMAQAVNIGSAISGLSNAIAGNAPNISVGGDRSSGFGIA